MARFTITPPKQALATLLQQNQLGTQTARFTIRPPKTSRAADTSQQPKEKQEQPGFFSRIGSDFMKRGRNVIESFFAPSEARKKGAGVGETLVKSGQAGLRVAGEVTGSVGDIISEGFSSITPQPVKDFLSHAVGTAIEKGSLPGGIKNKDVVKNIANKWNEFSTLHPEAAKDLESVFNISAILTGGAAEETGGIIARSGAVATGKTLLKTGDVLQKGLEEQSYREALEVTKPLLKESERAEALSKGRGIEKGKGIFRKTDIAPSSRDEEIARDVQSYVSSKKSPVENISSLRETIKLKSKNIEEVLINNPKSWENKGAMKKFFGKYLDVAKEDYSNKVIFASDTNAEKTYEAVKQLFLQKLRQQKGSGLFDLFKARQEFDAEVESKFPRTFSGLPTDNARTNAIRDIRESANRFIVNELPGGKAYEKILREETNMYRAIDNISERAAGSIGKNLFTKLTLTMRRHPWLSAEAVAGVGIGGYLLKDVITNPLVLGSLVAYGSYRTGKSVLTSRAVRDTLSQVLTQSGKALQDTDRKVIQELIQKLGEVPSTFPSAGVSALEK